MIQILCGDQGHRARCNALAVGTPGPSVADAAGPALDRKAQKIHTLTFWGHGDSAKLCGLTPREFVKKVKEWRKRNPTIQTVEIITCNSRHGTWHSKKLKSGKVKRRWVKSFLDRLKSPLKKLGLTLKALPVGRAGGQWGGQWSRWSILKFSSSTNTWLYITADGGDDGVYMWPGVRKVEDHQDFKATKSYVTAGTQVKATDTDRRYTIDFGTIWDLRDALIEVA